MIQDQQPIQQCQIHKLEFIAIDCSPECDQDKRNMCVKCLTTNTNQNVKLNSDIINEFLQLKKEYKSRVEGLFQEDLARLIEIENILKEIQKNLTLQFIKIFSLIKEQILNMTLEIDSLEKKLQSIQINQYFAFKNNQFQQLTENIQDQALIKIELEKLMELIQIKNCVSILQKMNGKPSIKETQKSKPFQQIQVIQPNFNIMCEKHNKSVILFDLSPGKAYEDRLACVSCISGQFGNYTEVDEVEKLWTEYHVFWNNIIQEQQKKYKDKIDPLKNVLIKGKENISSKLLEIKNYLDKSFFNVKSGTVRAPPEFKIWKKLDKQDALEISQILSRPKPKELLKTKIEQQYKDQVEELSEYLYEELQSLDLLVIQCYSKIDESLNLLKIDQCRINRGQILKIQQANKKRIKIPKLPNIQQFQQKQTYNLIKQDQQQILMEDCFAVAINERQTLLAAGCGSKIQVFKFIKGQLQKIEELQQYNNIFALIFLQQSNYLISTGCSRIYVWRIKERNTEQKFSLQHVLVNHQSTVYCVIVNKIENLMVSCSRDKTIMFWKIPEWECEYSLPIQTERVVSLSFNQSQNKLVACVRDGKFLIVEKVYQEYWTVTQYIKGSGYRATFIGDNCLVFQPQNGKKMKIYEFNQEDNQFKKFKNLKLKKGKQCCYLFPMIYNQEKNILINKNGRIVNVIKVINNQDYIVEQKIKFKVGKGDIYGTLTIDGNYLITWDITSKKLQVRQYQ